MSDLRAKLIERAKRTAFARAESDPEGDLVAAVIDALGVVELVETAQVLVAECEHARRVQNQAMLVLQDADIGPNEAIALGVSSASMVRTIMDLRTVLAEVEGKA